MKGKKTKALPEEVSWDKKVMSLIFVFFLVSMFPTLAMYYFAYFLIILVVFFAKVKLFLKSP